MDDLFPSAIDIIKNITNDVGDLSADKRSKELWKKQICSDEIDFGELDVLTATSTKRKPGMGIVISEHYKGCTYDINNTDTWVHRDKDWNQLQGNNAIVLAERPICSVLNKSEREKKYNALLEKILNENQNFYQEPLNLPTSDIKPYYEDEEPYLRDEQSHIIWDGIRQNSMPTKILIYGNPERLIEKLGESPTNKMPSVRINLLDHVESYFENNELVRAFHNYVRMHPCVATFFIQTAGEKAAEKLAEKAIKKFAPEKRRYGAKIDPKSKMPTFLGGEDKTSKAVSEKASYEALQRFTEKGRRAWEMLNLAKDFNDAWMNDRKLEKILIKDPHASIDLISKCDIGKP